MTAHPKFGAIAPSEVQPGSSLRLDGHEPNHSQGKALGVVGRVSAQLPAGCTPAPAGLFARWLP